MLLKNSAYTVDANLQKHTRAPPRTRSGRFQSMLSVRRATSLLVRRLIMVDISIHALRKESDFASHSDMPYIESNRRFAAYALSTILVPVGLPLPSRQERCGLKIYLAYVLPSQLQLSRILLGACERALILPTSAGEASPPPVLRRTCRCSIPHSARKLQNPHLLTKLHAS